MRRVRQDSFWYRLLDRALPAGNDCVCFRIDPDARVIRSRHGEVPLTAVERVWIRGERRRLLFGDRVTWTVVLTTAARAFVVLSLRDRAAAESIVADLRLEAPIDRYEVRDQRAR